MISAPASGQGKTSITAAIARHARRQGQRVRVFKTGPDYLDPMVLERASGHPVYQLDLFMGGLPHCQALLAEAATQADLILVEGVMGLFDGAPSSADLAAAFGLPVLVVLDASAMAQTFAALATGLARFRSDIRVAGVVANRVGSDGHAAMVAEGLPADLPLVAALKRQELSLPERHLGLVQALELPELNTQLDAWAEAWEAALARGTGLQPILAPIEFTAPPATNLGLPLAGRRIAVAQDACFSFIYPANLDCLRSMGAEVQCFSPLAGQDLPPCDALWLPGGYPELHAAALDRHPRFFEQLRTHAAAGKPLLAECGGMLVTAGSLTDSHGEDHAMAGLMPGHATLQHRAAALGLQEIAWPESEQPLRGHTFHYSTMVTPLSPLAQARNPNARPGRPGAVEFLYQQGPLRATYLHHYFPSNPQAVAAFFLGSAAPAPEQA